jgi:thymidylate synthase
MEEYLSTVNNVLRTGAYKPNRTAVDTISGFSKHYQVDVSAGHPLLTTKKMDGFRWNSMLHELVWYLSGEEHIRTLREETKIWDAWADDQGRLDTAYGRFWRRFPIPDADDALPGETWAGETGTKWDDNPDVDPSRWVNEEGDGRSTFDQIQYVIDMLNENPKSRRLVVNAWNPGNATVSTLPPCHYTFVFNVQGDELNVHLTQRSADLALGVPFNIACYSLLLKIIAQRTGFKPGTFSHTLVDAHVYCGDGDRGEWYGENLDELQEKLYAVQSRQNDVKAYDEVADWIEANAPEGATDPRGKPYDHVPGLLRQLTREPKQRPNIRVADKPLDELEADDIELENYESHPGIDFGVAE